MEGEFTALGEVLVVSPAWGRFHRHSLEAGGNVEPGTVLGFVEENGPEVSVVSPVNGVFLAWMAWAGERVIPGTPLARIAPEGA